MDFLNLLTVAAVAPPVRLADPQANVDTISARCQLAADQGVDLLVFPDLCLTGSSCGDLFGQGALLTAARQALDQLVQDSVSWPALVAVVSLPALFNNGTAKATAVLQAGQLLALMPVPVSPGENRPRAALFPGSLAADFPAPLDLHFSGGRSCRLFFSPDRPTGGLAAAAGAAATAGADLLIIQAAGPISPTGADELARRYTALSEIAGFAVVYSEAGAGESTGDSIYAGQGLVAEAGSLLWQRLPFAATADQPHPLALDLDVIRQNRTARPDTAGRVPFAAVNQALTGTDNRVIHPLNYRPISAHPFIPADQQHRQTLCRSVLEIQARGLAGRLNHLGKPRSIIGISGGLDSTLALLVTCRAYQIIGLSPDHIIGVSMPGFGTTVRTRSNAHRLMEALGVETLDIPITEAVNLHFRDIGHDPDVRDITYENAQARERTQILMDLANRFGGPVIGTGDLSELALGWCTYNGDQMSMYAVNAGVPKTLIRHIIKQLAADLRAGTGSFPVFAAPLAASATDPKIAAKASEIADLLEQILATPISPELLPPDEKGEISQHTEASTGPYELHDFFLYNAVRQAFPPAKVYALAKSAFARSVPAEKTGVSVTAYDPATIKHWLAVFYRRFFNQQFKRSALPDGPQIFDFSIAARGDRVLPADAKADLWLHLLEEAAKADGLD